MSAELAFDAVVIGRRRAADALAALAFVVATLVAVFAPDILGAAQFLGTIVRPLAMMVAGGSICFLLVVNGLLRRRARVTAAKGTLRVDGHTLDRAAWDDVYFVAAGGGGVVQFVRGKRRHVLGVVAPDLATACALLAAARGDGAVQGYTAPPPGSSAKVAKAVPIAFAMLPMWTTFTGPLHFLSMVGAAMPLAASVLRLTQLGRSVVLDRDALAVRSLGSERRFALATVAASPSGATALSLTGPEGSLTVDFADALDLRGGALVHRRDAVLADVAEAREALRAAAPVRELAEALARGDRTVDEWTADVRRLRVSDPYRGVRLRIEDLQAVASDPSATEDARAAAAYLLDESLDVPAARALVSERER